MTIAERARQIDKEEFAAESKAAIERALAYAQKRRDSERRKMNLYLGRPEDAASLIKPVLAVAHKHVFEGSAKTFSEWACHLGLTTSALHARVRKLGSLDRAIAMGAARLPGRQPIIIEHDGCKRTIKEWAALIGVEPMTIHNRLRSGWLLADALTIPSGARIGRPGVSSNFRRSKGTGAGSTTQETPNITFSGKVENA